MFQLPPSRFCHARGKASAVTGQDTPGTVRACSDAAGRQPDDVELAAPDEKAFAGWVEPEIAGTMRRRCTSSVPRSFRWSGSSRRSGGNRSYEGTGGAWSIGEERFHCPQVRSRLFLRWTSLGVQSPNHDAPFVIQRYQTRVIVCVSCLNVWLRLMPEDVLQRIMVQRVGKASLRGNLIAIGRTVIGISKCLEREQDGAQGVALLGQARGARRAGATASPPRGRAPRSPAALRWWRGRVRFELSAPSPPSARSRSACACTVAASARSRSALACTVAASARSRSAWPGR